MADRTPVTAGSRFGMLVAIEKCSKSADGHLKWICKCDCGMDAIRSTNSLKNALRSGSITSCGCTKPRPAKTHGMRGSSEYSSWRAAKYRCTNEKSKDYPRYGGAGIRMHESWINSFEAFISDMGMRPVGTSLDRIDGSKGYEPGNCRWATVDQQANNRKNNLTAVVDGSEMTAKELAAHLGINHCAAIKRIGRGRINV